MKLRRNTFSAIFFNFTEMFWRPSIAIKSLFIAVPLVFVKVIISSYELEFVPVNLLVGSVITSALFILGFYMAGLINDYKEAEKMAVEIRSMLEKIWEESKALTKVSEEFNLENVRRQLIYIIASFVNGVSQQSGFKDLKPCVEAVRYLQSYFTEIGITGVTAHSISQIKDTCTNLLKIIFRIYYIQRIIFLPSARLLVNVLATGVIVLVAITETQNYLSAVAVFGIFSYFVIYIRNLIYVLDVPFRQGEKTKDDISLFLLEEFKQEITTSVKDDIVSRKPQL